MVSVFPYGVPPIPITAISTLTCPEEAHSGSLFLFLGFADGSAREYSLAELFEKVGPR